MSSQPADTSRRKVKVCPSPCPCRGGDAPGGRKPKCSPHSPPGSGPGAVASVGGGAAAPVDHVVAQVPLEHEAPALDGAEQGLLEGTAVALQPAEEDPRVLALRHLLVQLLVGVDLGRRVGARQGLHARGRMPLSLAGIAGSGGFPGVPLAPGLYPKGEVPQGVENPPLPAGLLELAREAE